MNNRKWKYTIDIKQHLSNSTNNESIVNAAKGVVHELKRLPITLGCLEDLIYEFQDIVECTPDPADCDDLLSHFNYLLNDLYDFADYHRIWTGL